jgi:hypothetical protein
LLDLTTKGSKLKNTKFSPSYFLSGIAGEKVGA